MNNLEMVTEGVAPLTPEQFRDSIMAVQQELAQLPQIDCPLKHHFAPGQYAREIVLPTGSLVIGKIHLHAHVNVISKGRVSVITEDGRKDLQAPCTFVSMPGTKRAVYTHEECVWTTIHCRPDDVTDIELLEGLTIAPSYENFELVEAARKLLPEICA